MSGVRPTTMLTKAGAAGPARVMRAAALGDAVRKRLSGALHNGLLVLLLGLMFVPIVLMVSMSLRRTTLIYADFWALPIPPYFTNYAVTLVDLWLPLLRTLYVYGMGTVPSLFLAALAAYSFARLHLWGREVLFYLLVLLVMMIPGVVTLAPSFILVTRLGLRGSLSGMAVTYFVGTAFHIFLLTTFFRAQPAEIYESARVDGANEWNTLWHIAVPIARPVFVTLAIMNFASIYNDLIWPSLMLPASVKTMMLALVSYNPMVSEHLNRPDLGPLAAAYVFGSVPPLIIFITGMRYYVAGLTSGALKG